MKLKSINIAVLLLLASGLATAESETQKIAEVGGEITVDADGKIKAISLSNVKDPKAEEFFISKIKTWKFYPVEINGKPIEATSKFKFDLIFTYQPDKKLKQMEFANIIFEPSAIENELNNNLEVYKVYPDFSYPFEAWKEAVAANVIVAIDISADGRVRNSEISSMELINNNGRGNTFYSKLFSKSALNGARRMQFTKDFLASSGCANGCIRLYKSSYVFTSPAVWRSFVRVPVASIPWVMAAELKNIGETEQSQLVRLKKDPNESPIDIGS